MPLLKASMLYKDKKKSSSSTSPKLRAKAGDAKGLILLSLLQCTALLNNADSFQAAVIQCAQHLHNCYQQLSQQVFEPSALHREALKFAALYAPKPPHPLGGPTEMRIGEGKCQNLLEGEEVTSLAWLWHKPCSISLQPCTRSLRFEKKGAAAAGLGWGNRRSLLCRRLLLQTDNIQLI